MNIRDQFALQLAAAIPHTAYRALSVVDTEQLAKDVYRMAVALTAVSSSLLVVEKDDFRKGKKKKTTVLS